MADLHTLLASRLQNLKRAPDGKGWTAMCPICAQAGNGLRGKNQLKIWPNQAFHCVIEGDDKTHNKAIRAFLYENADPDTLAELSLEIVDPDPKVEMDKVYPEDMLSKLNPDYRYWVGRGISEEVLRKMEGGMAPADEKSKLSNRYCLPIRDEKHRIIGWTGRLVSENSFGPKHKHLVKSSRCIYPIHVADEPIRASRKVVLLESPGDYLSCAQVGLWNAIVLLGLNLNARILGYLVSVNPTHIIISTNADTERVNKVTGAISHPGQDAADKLRAKLIPFFGEDRVIIRFPSIAVGKDWNECLQKAPDEVMAFKAEVDAL